MVNRSMFSPVVRNKVPKLSSRLPDHAQLSIQNQHNFKESENFEKHGIEYNRYMLGKHCSF